VKRFVPIPAEALASGLLPCYALFVVTAELELLAVRPAGCVVPDAFAVEVELSVFEFELTGRGGLAVTLGAAAAVS
jgi:hypothetical protein